MMEEIANIIPKERGDEVLKSMDKVAHKTNAGAVAKLTTVVDGKLQINNQPPLLMPIHELLPKASAEQVEQAIRLLIEKYRESLSEDRRYLIDQYSYVDCGRKVVGVGSVGTRAWVLVLSGRDENDPLVLQIKEAQGSVLEPYTAANPYKNNGQRVVEGQKLMQAQSDIMLGWVHGRGVDGGEHDYYIRQLWDWKASPDLDKVRPNELMILSKICGWTLARAHARSGNRFAVAGYLGSSDRFDKSMNAFAEAYATQNDYDYAAFKDALSHDYVLEAK